MGLGRRKFVKLMTTALAGVSYTPFQSVITNEDLYVNRQLGIMFHKPSDWGYLSLNQFNEVKTNVILSGEFEEYKEQVFELLGDPISIVSKYLDEDDDNDGKLNPTITLNITPAEEILMDSEGSTFEEAIAESRQVTSHFLKEFEIIKDFGQTNLSNCNSYEYDAKYMFEHKELTVPLQVHLKVIKIEHRGLYYDINMHQSLETEDVTKEFDLFRDSIVMV